jgi:hypothetical protein
MRARICKTVNATEVIALVVELREVRKQSAFVVR